MIVFGLVLMTVVTTSLARPEGASAATTQLNSNEAGASNFGPNNSPYPGNPYRQQQQGPFYSPNFGYKPQFSPNAGVPGFPQPFNGFPTGFPSGFPTTPFVPFAPFQPLQFAPLPPLLSPTAFNEALAEYTNSLQQQYANYNGGSFVWSSPGASAYAYSSLGPINLYQEQQDRWNAWKNQAAAAPQSQYNGPNVAGSSGLVGPNGVYQSAFVNPENPNSPNVETRFASSEPGPNGGYLGVQTSSFSSSSDVNGMQTERKGAITTVNDNGKITTYKAGF